jgi:signal transduction histidine kinase
MQLDQARRQGASELGHGMPLDTLVDAIRHAMAAIRGVLDALDADVDRPEARLTIPQAVRITARLYGVRVHWRGLRSLEDIESDRADQLAVCLSEAVTNACRHGGATQVWIDLARTGAGHLLARVRDDGHGVPGGALVEGHGLRHVRQRLEAMGGFLALSTGREGGVTWRCDVPLRAASETPPIPAAAPATADPHAGEDR